MRWVFVAVAAIGFFVAILLGQVGGVFGLFDRHYEWRQKTTIVVETPEGQVSASSVVRVKGRVGRGRSLDQFGAAATVVEGEATAIEVAPGRWVYVTLHNRSEADRIRFALKDQFGLMSSAEIMPRLRRMVGEPFTLLPDSVTRLITFEDPSDARTAREIDPNELASVFGPGYALVDVTLQIVRDDVTEGGLGPIGQWIADYPGRLPIKPYLVTDELNGFEFKKVER